MSTYNFNYIDSVLLSDTKKAANINYALNKKLSFKCIENAVILPFKKIDGMIHGGVLSSNGDMIEGKYYNFSNTEIIYCDKIAIFLGYWVPYVWGHCLTDALKKIWFIVNDYYKNYENGNVSFIFLSFGNSDIKEQSFVDLLYFLGIDASNLKLINKITFFNKLYFPDDCLFEIPTDIERLISQRGGLLHYTETYKKLINIISDSVQKESFDNVYFSGSRLKTKKTWNERSIEKVFRKNGFKIFYPETIPFSKQVAIIKGCKQFACTEGSISHNSVFLSEGAHLILIRKSAYHNEFQYMINHLNNIYITYIDAHLSLFVNDNYCYDGPFFLYVNDNFIRFANNSGFKKLKSKFPYKLFHRYLEWSWSLYADNFSACLKNEDLYYQKLNLIMNKKPSFILFNCYKKIRHILGDIKRKLFYYLNYYVL